MVPRTSRQGCSFTGAWKYYAHDKRTAQQQAQGQEVRTRERVGFVHTENLGGIEDDRAAIGLMIDTARQSRRCEKPVYAFSLGWHPEETPSREDMLKAGREALAVLKMQDHQALMIAHTDTAHPHLHIIVNRIHPETGKAINIFKDQEKLSAWALEYERRQGKVYCPARVFNALARQVAQEQDGRPAPSRYVDNTLAECWTRSDSGKSFRAALEAKGWGLARGDRKEAVLMAVAPSGRAFAVLRELNKGLAKGQTITGAAFDRQTADLKREDLRPVKEVQEEMERRARSRSGEKSQKQTRPRRAERDQRPAQEQGRAQTPDEGKQWALEMRIRAERRALDERQAQARARQQDKAEAGMEKARQEAMKVQQIRQQEQALREVQERLKQGGWFYRVSGKAKQDRETVDIWQELLEQSRARVNGWMERERKNGTWEVQRLAHRQETERAELEKKIEQAQKIGYWREGGPERTAQQRPEPGEQQEHGRGGRTRER